MNINIYKSPQMCLYYESNTNSCSIPAGILPESTESGHSCRIPGFLLDSAGIPPEFLDSCQIPPEFRRNSRIPAGISGGVKSSASFVAPSLLWHPAQYEVVWTLHTSSFVAPCSYSVLPSTRRQGGGLVPTSCP